jgi:hypothetical protein
MLQPANSGNPVAMIPSPKFTSTFGPFYKTEFFLGAGLGYHSNDARGVVTSQVPGDPSTPQSGTPFLVRSAGAEIGARTKIVVQHIALALYQFAAAHRRRRVFSRLPSTRSTAGWGISSPMAGASSLTRSIC